MSELFQRVKVAHEEFITEAESNFSRNMDYFTKTLSSMFPSFDVSKFNPIAATTECYYCATALDLIAEYSPMMAETELKSTERELKEGKKAIKKSYVKGSYEDSHIEANKHKTEEWFSDKTRFYLSEFAYFDALRPSTKVKYLLEELFYYGYSELVESNIHGSTSYVKYPVELVGMPMFMSSTSAKPLSDIDEKKNTMSFYFENTTDEGDTVRVYIAKDVLLPEIAAQSEDSLENFKENYMANKALGPYDQQVFICIQNLINVEVCETGYAVIKLKDFIRRVDPTIPAKNDKKTIDKISYHRQKIEESLFRFRDYDIVMTKETASGKKKSGTRAYALFLTGFDIDYQKAGVLRLEFSRTFLDNWMEQKTEKIISESWEKASFDTRQIMFFLQAERIKSRTSSYCVSVPILKFQQTFPGKRKDRFLEELEKSFKELMENHIFIKNYQIEKPIISFQFFPLSKEELDIYQFEKNEK